MNFAEWLISNMHKREWSNADLANKAKLSRQAIGYYVAGRIPDNRALEKIADAFGIPPEEIYRAAGLLSPIDEKEEFLKRIEKKIARLPNDEARRIVEGTIDLLVPDKMPPKDSRVRK